MSDEMSDTFSVKCWNCSKEWTVEVGEYESIGYEKDLFDSAHGDKLITKKGQRSRGIQCSACNQYGNHGFTWSESVDDA